MSAGLFFWKLNEHGVYERLDNADIEYAQQGMVGKGITHIVGGIMAYHLGPTIYVIGNTFGFNL